MKALQDVVDKRTAAYEVSRHKKHLQMTLFYAVLNVATI